MKNIGTYGTELMGCSDEYDVRMIGIPSCKFILCSFVFFVSEYKVQTQKRADKQGIEQYKKNYIFDLFQSLCSLKLEVNKLSCIIFRAVYSEDHDQ